MGEKMTLREGDTGPEVEELQKVLNEKGASLKVDGDFGPLTEAAVIAFQSAKGLDVDGIVGPITWAALHGTQPPPIEHPQPGEGPVIGTGEYSRDFKSMVFRSDWSSRIKSATDLVLRGKASYLDLEKKTGVPWYITGVIHLLEGECSFSSHLHNGDSLRKRTVHVPAGRPRTGTPPFTWEESAIDALAYDGIQPPLKTIDEQFRALERFNGMGYRGKGIKTPYLWSGSNHYTRGKFIRDGVWSSTAVSAQVGCACIIKSLIDRGLI